MVSYYVRNEDGTVTDKATINSSTGALTADAKTGEITPAEWEKRSGEALFRIAIKPGEAVFYLIS